MREQSAVVNRSGLEFSTPIAVPVVPVAVVPIVAVAAIVAASAPAGATWVGRRPGARGWSAGAGASNGRRDVCVISADARAERAQTDDGAEGQKAEDQCVLNQILAEFLTDEVSNRMCAHIVRTARLIGLARPRDMGSRPAGNFPVTA